MTRRISPIIAQQEAALRLYSDAQKAKQKKKAPEALQLLMDCLVVTRTLEDTSSEAQILSEVGDLYQLDHNFGKAREFYEEALKLMIHEAIRPNRMRVLFQLAQVLRMLKEEDGALQLYDEVILIAEQLRDYRFSGLSYTIRGQILFIREQCQLGMKEMIRGLEQLQIVNAEEIETLIKRVRDLGKRISPGDYESWVRDFTENSRLRTALLNDPADTFLV